ncbi:hypothetical protein QOZ80_2BG0188270 [Eleusine coracana subsp. coracana]|nr:hypothetical protein QOZ80_2BG0188270 [Eleusine coracana subsp. coracana]
MSPVLCTTLHHTTASSKGIPVDRARRCCCFFSSFLSHCSAAGTRTTATRNAVRVAVVDDGMPPQLDFDAMVRGVGGGVAYDEEFLDGSEHVDPYAPAESLRLRIGEDIDWSDVVVIGGGGAAVLQRGDSTKGAGANPKSAARRSVHQAAAPRSSMSSAPAPRKVVPVAVIGGLPGKVRCSPCRLGGRARVFAAAGEQQAVAGEAGHRELEEPGSPKVSCLGAVRPEQRNATTSRRASWRPWFAARVTCCFSSGHRMASTGSEETDD